jgi:hypothetical protein
MHKRLCDCRDRCQRHEVFRLMLLSRPQLALRNQAFMEPMPGNMNEQELDPFALTQLVNKLQSELQARETDLEELELELAEALKDKDQTPSAMLFFSMLYDPSFVPTLQQLSLQFSQFKGFLNQTVDMDFTLLRKRMMICLSHLPTLDKLIEKYSQLYKRWSQHRLHYFTSRKLRGSAIDNMSSCPLCYHALLTAEQEQNVRSCVPDSVLPENLNGAGTASGAVLNKRPGISKTKTKLNSALHPISI